MKKIKFTLIVLLGLSLAAFAEEAKPKEHFVFDVGGGFATYSSLAVLGGAMDDFDYCNNGKCDPPDEVDYKSNYAVASLGARYIFTPQRRAWRPLTRTTVPMKVFAKVRTMKCTVRLGISWITTWFMSRSRASSTGSHSLTISGLTAAWASEPCLNLTAGWSESGCLLSS